MLIFEAADCLGRKPYDVAHLFVCVSEEKKKNSSQGISQECWPPWLEALSQRMKHRGNARRETTAGVGKERFCLKVKIRGK